MKKKCRFPHPWGIKLKNLLQVYRVILFLCILSPGAIVAQERKDVINLSMKDVTLKEVIWEIEKQSEFVFAYNANDLAKAGRVSVEIKDKTVREALDICLKGTGLLYVVQQNIIVIKQKGARLSEVKMLTLKGVVTDKGGVSLPGVTVLVKGTTVGVSTNMDGQYTLNVAKRDSLVLVYSFIGLKTKEGETINVVLEEDSQVIDEVVVSTGYNTVNRRDMVGSYTTLKGADIIMPAYNSIDQMLQGRVAGMVVMNTSSRVGTSPKIKIRGSSTILGNQSPLWVVDGIIQEDPLELDASSMMTQELENIIGSQVSWLNPMDIETITVLKDASATAVYGSKASNGVIVITTKKGKMNRLTVNYTGNLSINSKPNYGMFNYMNSQERIIFSQEAFNAGAFYRVTPIAQPYTYEGVLQMYLNHDLSREEYQEKKAFLESVNTDWFDLLTQSSVSMNHNVSVSGGSEKITYNVSLGYSDMKGQEIGNNSKNLTGRVSVDARLRDNIRLNASINGASGKNTGFGSDVNPLTYATSTSRAIPAYDENGDPVFYQKQASYKYNNNVKSLSYNFMNERDNSGAQVDKTSFNAALNFSWNIFDWLKYEFTGGYSYNDINSESWSLEQTYKIASAYRGYDYNSVSPGSAEFKAAILPFGGVLLTSDALQRSYNVQNKLLVSKEFNADHRLNVMLGMELRSTAIKNNTNTVYGYAPDRGEKLIKPTYPGDIVPVTGSVTEDWGILENLYNGRWSRMNKTDNYLSFFATLAYSLKNRYVFNFSIRNDASNRFGQDVNNRFDPTYSFGLSWRVTDEPFLAKMDGWVSGLNLRATYGIQGNALTRLGPDLRLNQGGVASVYNQYESSIASIPNPKLSWEKTHSVDLGLDFELFKMFSLTFDYYWKRSNAVVSQDIAFEYGMTSMQLNGGKVENSGVEFTVAFTPLKKEDWALSISLNSSKNWNKARNQQYEATLNDALSGSGTKILKKGYPLSGFWSYSFAGLGAEDGRPLFNNLDVPAGERDSKMDPTTFLVYSGESEPAFTGGMNFSLRYKSLTLSSGFSLLIGAKKRLPSPWASSSAGAYIPDATVSLSKDLNKRWKKPGDEKHTNIPGFVTSKDYTIILPNNDQVSWMDMWASSDALVVDASFLRCRQISLAWNMAQDWCKKIGLKSLSLNATVNNVFVIGNKRFNGFDPELGDSVMPKSYSVGINVGF